MEYIAGIILSAIVSLIMVALACAGLVLIGAGLGKMVVEAVCFFAGGNPWKGDSLPPR